MSETDSKPEKCPECGSDKYEIHLCEAPFPYGTKEHQPHTKYCIACTHPWHNFVATGAVTPQATPNVYTEIRPVLDRLRTKNATVGDFITYLKFEMKEIMKVLPPEVQAGARSDGFHAGCCALRSYATLLQLEAKVCPPAGEPEEATPTPCQHVCDLCGKRDHAIHMCKKCGEAIRPAEPEGATPTPDAELWMEFLVRQMCSLCGQSGIIDTRGIKTPANFECGGLHYCICPNGRALKAKNAPKLEWLNQAKRAGEPEGAETAPDRAEFMKWFGPWTETHPDYWKDWKGVAIAYAAEVLRGRQG